MLLPSKYWLPSPPHHPSIAVYAFCPQVVVFILCLVFIVVYERVDLVGATQPLQEVESLK